MPDPGRPGFLSTTVIGAVTFLFPLLLVIFLVRQGIDLVQRPVGKLAELFPVVRLLGPLGELLLALLLLVLLAWIGGLLATTGPGRLFSQRFRQSPLFALPPLSFARGLAASYDAGEDKVTVVLVPSDQGRTIAFLFGSTEGETLCVYVPSAPNWTSGSISFAAREDVEFTDMSFLDATRLLMRMGGRGVTPVSGLPSGTAPPSR